MLPATEKIARGFGRNSPQAKGLTPLPQNGIQKFAGLTRQYYRFRRSLLIKI
jgi:hypothetical protein